MTRFASLIIASDNGNVVCSVSWIRMADKLNTYTFHCLHCKIVVVTDVMLKYFLELGPQDDFFLQIINLDHTR